MSSGRVIRARLLAWSLCITTVLLAALAVTSIWGNVWFVCRDIAVGVFHGQLYVRWGFSNPTFQILSPGVHARWFDGGWDWYRTWHLNLSAFRSVDVPLLAPIMALGAAAAWSTSYYRAIRSAGRCATCGYDLRGLGERTRCPECGRPFA